MNGDRCNNIFQRVEGSTACRSEKIRVLISYISSLLLFGITVVHNKKSYNVLLEFHIIVVRRGVATWFTYLNKIQSSTLNLIARNFVRP